MKKSNLHIANDHVKRMSECASQTFFDCDNVTYDELSNVKGCVVLKETYQGMSSIVGKAKQLFEKDLQRINDVASAFEQFDTDAKERIHTVINFDGERESC